MVQIIDHNTGEAIEQNEELALVPATVTQITGPFVGYEAKYGQRVFTLAEYKLAERTDLTPPERQRMLSTYSHEKVELIEDGGHMNEVMDILGAMVVYHEPYKPKSGEDIIKPGYFRMLLKTNIIRDHDLIIAKRVVTVKKNLLLSVSAQAIVKYFLTLIESDRWYDFQEPITGYFSGSKGTGYSFNTLSADELADVQEILDSLEK